MDIPDFPPNLDELFNISVNALDASDSHKSFIRIWMNEREDGALLPEKSVVDPIDLGRAGLLPSIWLAEREANGDFRYRISGEMVDRVFGRSLMGERISSCYPVDALRSTLGLWHRMLEQKLGFHSQALVYVKSGVPFKGERMSLPLVNENGEPKYIIGLTIYDDQASLPERHQNFLSQDQLSRTTFRLSAL